MTIENIAFWEMILDAIALFLGGTAIAGVMMLRRRSVKNDQAAEPDQRTQQFNEVLLDFVQQTERTFQRVSDVLREGRESLQGVIPDRPQKPPEALIGNVASLTDASRRRTNRATRRGKIKEKRNEQRSDDNRYSEVAELAQNGLSEGEIARKVQLPRGEIELIMELNKG